MFAKLLEISDQVSKNTADIASGAKRHNDTEGYFFNAVFAFFGVILVGMFYLVRKNDGLK